MNSTGLKAQQESSAAARPAASQSDTGKPSASPWALTWRTGAALAIAMLIGSIPLNLYVLRAMPFTFANTSVYSVRHAPADDTRLLAWARSKPEFSKFQIERDRDRVVIRYEYQAKLSSFGIRERSDWERQLQSQLHAFGYELSLLSERGGTVDFVGEIFRLALGPFFLFAGQAGMLIVGIWNIRRLAAKGRALPPLFAAPWAKTALWGAGVGVALLAFGFFHDFLLRWALGREAPGPWTAIQGSSSPVKVWLLLFGAIGAPVAEEVFFRGYMFGSFKGEGYVGFGLVISALIFAAAHWSDPYHMGGIFIYGLVLAWSYHRSGSLLTPMLAHLINNATGLILLFFGSKSV